MPVYCFPFSVFSAATFFDDSYVRNFPVSVRSDGAAYWVFGGVISTGCKLTMTKYPFDEHICLIEVQPWANYLTTINVTNGLSEMDKSLYEEHGLWTLKNTHAYRSEREFAKITLPYVVFRMHLVRKAGFFIFNIVAPCILLMWLTILMFWLPVESGEKTGLGVTLLLAYAVFQIMIADSTPKTSESTPLLSMHFTTLYLILQMFLSFCGSQLSFTFQYLVIFCPH